jgi:hypothetical protein
MPTNVTLEYMKAEAEYHKAKTIPDKIKALELMLSTAPGHKGAEVLRRQLNQRIAKLKKEQIVSRRKKAARYSLAVKKEGFQIVIIGFPNSGKSTLLSKLTNARPRIASYPFTTKEPEVGMMDYEGGQVQLVEVPALAEDACEKQGELLSIVSSADGIIMILDESDAHYQKAVLEGELAKAKIDKPTLVAMKHSELTPKGIFAFFSLIRIYTKEPGEKPHTEKPVIMMKGCDIMDVAKEIHKDFSKNLKFARVWGSARFSGQRVEKDYVLKDKDVVELHI